MGAPVEPATSTRRQSSGCHDGFMASRISERIGAISESATLAVDAKAKALKAAGRPVIGFGAGEPDFPTPDYIVEAAVEAARDPKNHHYSPAGGLPELKQAIADKFNRDNKLPYKPENITVGAGGKHCLYMAFMAVLNPGDEVLIPSPFWVSYPEQAKLAGANDQCVDKSQAGGTTGTGGAMTPPPSPPPSHRQRRPAEPDHAAASGGARAPDAQIRPPSPPALMPSE